LITTSPTLRRRFGKSLPHNANPLKISVIPKGFPVILPLSILSHILQPISTAGVFRRPPSLNEPYNFLIPRIPNPASHKNAAHLENALIFGSRFDFAHR
jgi:hypothetical protein